MEIVIPLSKNCGEPLYRQIFRGIRNASLNGSLRAGDRLPSTRELADQLGVSRTVVLLGYELLRTQGFVKGHRGSGTFISDVLPTGRRQNKRSPARIRLSEFGVAVTASVIDFPVEKHGHLRYDFAFGRNSMATFPFGAWNRIQQRTARATSVGGLDYGPSTGAVELREAICSHVRRSRGVVCDSSEIIIVNGAQQALDITARLLINRGDYVVLEEPHYQGTREVLRANGARLIGVTVDERGLDPVQLPTEAKAVYVTPSHQFPTGVILSLPRRMALLSWASRTNAIIIENDYDGDFHYDDAPVESLHALDREGRTVYVGTFSRTIFPSLRIGYVIVPKALRRAFTNAKWLSDQHSATLEQKTLAEFIFSGLYERHLRKLRKANHSRRTALLRALREHFDDDRISVTGGASGSHVVLWPRTSHSEQRLIEEAAKRAVGIYGISHCFLHDARRVGIMLGYARLDEAEIRKGIALLSQVM